jgi:hypothetical protein
MESPTADYNRVVRALEAESGLELHAGGVDNNGDVLKICLSHQMAFEKIRKYSINRLRSVLYNGV